MKKAKKIGMLMIFVLVVIILSACNNSEDVSASSENDGNGEMEKMEIHIDYFMWNNVERMAELATDIIRGEVLDQRVEWKNLIVPREAVVADMLGQGMTQEEIDFEIYGFDFEPYYNLMTVYTIYVLEVFQGNHVAGDVIEMMRRGGEYGNEYWFVSDAIELSAGIEFVLFLYTTGLTDNPYILLSHVQGAYSLAVGIGEDKKLTDLDYWDMELKKTSDLDPIMISVKDLVEIAEENELLNGDDVIGKNGYSDEDGVGE
ncbi:MAG: hypothetical protein FWE25_08370 [Lachnospiraceae bacterium]|nr:hypothetical protein [Lachnospiraceae bacterium]